MITPNQAYHNPFEAAEIATLYDGWFNTPLGQAVDRLEKQLIYRLARPRAGERALDVGTGTGHYALDLARQGLQVTGFDRSEAMLAVARRANPAIAWEQGEAEALPYTDSSFDLVISVTALEFVRDPARALAEMVRVAAPGGRVVVGALNARSSWAQMYRREAALHETPFRYAHFFTPDEFVGLLCAHGRLAWQSAVFIPPSGRGLALAGALERIGQTLQRGRGALLVGRIVK